MINCLLPLSSSWLIALLLPFAAVRAFSATGILFAAFSLNSAWDRGSTLVPWQDHRGKARVFRASSPWASLLLTECNWSTMSSARLILSALDQAKLLQIRIWQPLTAYRCRRQCEALILWARPISTLVQCLDQWLSFLQFVHDYHRQRSHVVLIQRKNRKLRKHFLIHSFHDLLQRICISLIYKEPCQYILLLMH